MSLALEARNLAYAYDRVRVLADVSFAVREGEYLSVIGPNGAGKSTLLKCLNRVLTGWSGEVSVLGTPSEQLSQRKLATMLGYVPQPGGRTMPFTVTEFVLMGRYPYLSPFTLVSREDRTAVREALSQVGVEHLAHRQIDSLSGGEQQMAYIAAALVQGARVLLLDEPTAFLDYRHQVDSSRLLRRLNRDQGVTILAVTHDINHAVAFSDRILAIKDGRISFNGTPEALVADSRLEAIYDTPFRRYIAPSVETPVLMPCCGAAL